MTDWGLHIYYKIVRLVNKTSVDRKGFPWNLIENSNSKATYVKGTCPQADSLFERGMLFTVPSCLTDEDESDIISCVSVGFEPSRRVPENETYELSCRNLAVLNWRRQCAMFCAPNSTLSPVSITACERPEVQESDNRLH
jgi:hypothetical protein